MYLEKEKEKEVVVVLTEVKKQALLSYLEKEHGERYTTWDAYPWGEFEYRVDPTKEFYYVLTEEHAKDYLFDSVGSVLKYHSGLIVDKNNGTFLGKVDDFYIFGDRERLVGRSKALSSYLKERDDKQYTLSNILDYDNGKRYSEPTEEFFYVFSVVQVGNELTRFVHNNLGYYNGKKVNKAFVTDPKKLVQYLENRDEWKEYMHFDFGTFLGEVDGFYIFGDKESL